MEWSGPFTAEEIWDQFKIICGKSRLRDAPRQQELLRKLLERRLSGVDDSDAYRGKELSWLLGERATDIGKVLGVQLRVRLGEYYATVGRGERIVIRISSTKVFRPEITENFGVLPPAAEGVVGGAIEKAYLVLDSRGVSELERFGRAIEFLEKGLSEFPEDPRLLAMRANMYANVLFIAPSPQRAAGMVKDLVVAANTQWDIDAHTATAKAILMALIDWDWNGAMKGWVRAAKLSGGWAQYEWLCTRILMVLGSRKAGIELRRQVVEWGGKDVVEQRMNLAEVLMIAGELDEAERILGKLLEVRPVQSTFFWWAVLHEAKGMPLEAAEIMRTSPDFQSGGFESAIWVLLFRSLGGDASTKQLALEWLSQFASARWASASGDVVWTEEVTGTDLAGMGILAFVADDWDQAVYLLKEAAVAHRHRISLELNVMPYFRHLYDHPGFRSLVVETLGLKLHYRWVMP